MSADTESARGRPRRRRRLVEAIYSPNSYGLVLLLIVVTYAMSAVITASWAASLVLAVQIATVWVTLRASQAHRRIRLIAAGFLLVSAVAAIANLVVDRGDLGTGVTSVVSGLLYLVAPFAIVRHLVLRRTVDIETVLGAVAAYLMVGIFFAFAYRAVGVLQPGPFFGSMGEGTFSEDLFFSFTTLTTTGYGNFIPAGNPGQSFAVLEMVVGQLFLVTAVAKVVSSWQPGQKRTGLRTSTEGE
jgi:Ion channel